VYQSVLWVQNSGMKIAILIALWCSVAWASPRFSRNAHPFGKAPDSCVDRCGQVGVDQNASCQCNPSCLNYSDCCSDFLDNCNTCKGRCGAAYDRTWPCQCNTACSSNNNCCPDYSSLCGGSSGTITNDELYALAAELHGLDVNGCPNCEINLQGRTTSGNQADLAPQPLFTSVPDDTWTKPTVAAMLTLYDNYVPEVGTNEDHNAQEQEEEEAFLTAIFATDVTIRAHQFLASKGLIGADINELKEYYRTIWFGLYSRASGSVGSSGFEHVYLGELKNGISGFHSWHRYYKEELAGKMNYLGYINIVEFGTGTLIEMPMKWNNIYKSISSIAVGGSPEVELALATVCFMARPNTKCPVQGPNGARYSWQTYTQAYNGKTYVGSAYPTL